MENIFNKVFGDPAVNDDFKNKFAYHVTEFLKKASITHIILVDQSPKVLAHYYGNPANLIALLLSTLVKIVGDQQSNFDEKEFEECKRQLIKDLQNALKV